MSNKTSFKAGNKFGKGPGAGNKNAANGKLIRRSILSELHFYEDAARGIQKGAAVARIAKRAVEDALSDDFIVRHAARQWIADRVDGKAREHVELDLTQRIAEDLTDDELSDIIRDARGGGDRAADEEIVAEESSGIH